MTHDPICPYCQQLDSKVIDTRRSLAGSVWRRRHCVCGQRFTTYEQVNTMPRIRALIVSLRVGRDVSS